MNEEDAALWHAYAANVKKIDAKKPNGLQRKKSKQTVTLKSPICPPSSLQGPHTRCKESARQEPASKEPAISSVPLPLQQKLPEPLDVRVERNLSLGAVVVEARLDLHGRTEADAFALFAAFLEKHFVLGHRLVLVITGKGKDGRSVLRANFPRWCASAPFSEMVRAVREAAPLHGGAGAYYVLLRKNGK